MRKLFTIILLLVISFLSPVQTKPKEREKIDLSSLAADFKLEDDDARFPHEEFDFGWENNWNRVGDYGDTYQQLLQETENLIELREFLFDDYDNNVPPGYQVEILNMNVIFIGFQGLDVQSGTNDIITYVSYSWFDPRLVWNPEDFSNITSLSMDPGSGAEDPEAYVPEISFFPIFGSIGILDFQVLGFIARCDGVVFLSAINSIPFFCPISVKYFPFDKNICPFSVIVNSPGIFSAVANNSFSPWANEAMQLEDLKIEISEENTVFEVRQIQLEGVSTTLRTNYTIIRRPSQYYIRFIIPTAIFTFISFATFAQSSASADRLGICLTSMLSIVALDFVIAGLVPSSDSPTFIDIFTLVSIFFALFAVFESGFVIYLHTCDHPIFRRPENGWIAEKTKPIFNFQEDDDPHSSKEAHLKFYQEIVLWLVDESGRISNLRFLHIRDEQGVVERIECLHYHRFIAYCIDMVCLVTVPVCYIVFVAAYIVSSDDNKIFPRY